MYIGNWIDCMYGHYFSERRRGDRNSSAVRIRPDIREPAPQMKRRDISSQDQESSSTGVDWKPPGGALNQTSEGHKILFYGIEVLPSHLSGVLTVLWCSESVIWLQRCDGQRVWFQAGGYHCGDCFADRWMVERRASGWVEETERSSCLPKQFYGCSLITSLIGSESIVFLFYYFIFGHDAVLAYLLHTNN